METNTNTTISQLEETIAHPVESAMGVMEKIAGEIESELAPGETVTCGTSSVNASTVTTTAAPPIAPENVVVTFNDDYMSMAYDPKSCENNPDKLIELVQGSFSDQAVSAEVAKVLVPRFFFDSTDKPAYGQARYFRYFRGGFHVQMQVNAPMGAAGALIFYYIPANVNTDWSLYEFGSFTNIPHVIVDISEETTADLYVPYINNKNFASTDSNDLGAFIVSCWSPLRAGTSTSNNIDVTLYGEILEMNLQCPRPYTGAANQGPTGTRIPKPNRAASVRKYVRNRIDIAEGPGTANLANRLVTNCAPSTALAGERASVDSRTAGAKCRVKDFVSIARVKSVMSNGWFDWTINNARGSSLYEATINLNSAINTAVLGNAYNFYRGSIVFELTVFCSSFNKGRLKLCFYPLHDSTYTLAQSQNSIYTICDVSKSHKFQLTVPFTSDTWQKACTDFIGRISIFVTNKLTVNTTAPAIVGCVITMRMGDDAIFTVPRDGDIVFQGNGDEGVFYDDSLGTDVGLGAPDGGELHTEENQPMFLNFKLIKQSIYTASHTTPDNVMGRAFSKITVALQPDTNTVQDIGFPRTAVSMMALMYNYFSGEVNITVVNEGTDILNASHAWDDIGSTTGDIMAKGQVLIPGGEMYTFCCPYYSLTPLRLTRSTTALGQVFLYASAQANVSIYVTLRNPNFFFMVPRTKVTTSRLALGSESLPVYLTTPQSYKDLQNNPDQDTMPRKNVIRNPNIYNQAGAELVYKQKPLYRHYGIKCGGKIFHLDSEDPLQAAISGVAKFLCKEDDGSWTTEKNFNFNSVFKNSLEMNVDKLFHYNVANNCESIVREMFGDYGAHQGTSIILISIMINSMLMSCMLREVDTEGMFDFMRATAVSTGEAIKGSYQKAHLKLMEFFSSTFFDSVEVDFLRICIRTAIRLMCYLVLYIHNPNIFTTLSVGALLWMDISGIQMTNKSKQLMKILIEGDIAGLSQVCLEQIQDDSDKELFKSVIDEVVKVHNYKPSDQGPLNDVNQGFNLLKNITWTFDLLKKVITFVLKKIGFIKDELKEWLIDNSDNAASLFSQVDHHICEMRNITYSRNFENQQKTKDYLVKLNVLRRAAMKSHIREYTTYCNTLIGRLNSLQPGVPTVLGSARMEPIGVWLSGDAGCGKSVLAGLIRKNLEGDLGFKTFYHPSGSEFFDGYTQQQIHVLDDLGQCRDELEMKVLCQCMSCTPFVLPMADLGEKGMTYESKIVLVTTNKTDYATTSLLSQNALSRRFPLSMTIRPVKNYSTGGKLDLTKVHADGGFSILKNDIWEYRDFTNITMPFKPLNFDHLLLTIKTLYNTKVSHFSIMDQGSDDELNDDYEESSLLLAQCGILQWDVDDVYLDCVPERPVPKHSRTFERIRQKFSSCFSKFRQFCSKHNKLIQGLAIFTSALSAIIGVVHIVKVTMKKKDETPYNGTQLPNKVAVSKNYEKVALKKLSDQGPEFAHLLKFSVLLKIGSQEFYGVVLGGNKIITYGHIMRKIGDSGVLDLEYNHKIYEGVKYRAQMVTISDCENDAALVMLENFPFILPSARRYLVDLEDSIVPAMLVSNSIEATVCNNVSNARKYGSICTREGTVSNNTIGYIGKTYPGLCGSMLIAKIDGNFKILGFHVAGGGGHGFSIGLDVQLEGMVVEKLKLEKPVFCNSKTALRQSPLHDVLEGDDEPSALHSRDPRIKVEVDNLVKHAEQKYRNNKFDPPRELLVAAKNKILKEYSINSNKLLTISEAILGNEIMPPLDRSTSPGHKYQGKDKRSLINFETGEINDSDLYRDVLRIYHGVMNLEEPDTYFTVHLKDELRPKHKIEKAGTRAIEASNFDYVIAHRMIVGDLFSQIMTKSSCGNVSVGLNVYTDFNHIIRSLYDYNICMDYSKFDGSLSRGLMEEAVDLMAKMHFCPNWIRTLYKPVVTSVHLVHDEVWYVEGGMPSGSPCTSILNSFCNLIVLNVVAFSLGSLDHKILVYGDDCVLSFPKPYDFNSIPLIISKFFGMDVTNFDKTDKFTVLKPMEISYLKRTPKFFPGTSFIIGALDLANIESHLRWTRGSFKDQLYSALLEMALHGPEEYNKFRKKILDTLNMVGISVPGYEMMIMKAEEICLF